MNDTYYFQHDYNSRTDPKIKRLLMKYGIAGYGIFWALVEDLYNNANALQTDYESIAFDLRVDCDIIKSIINDSELFIIEDGYFGSMAVQKRLDQRDKKSEKARESANKRWERNNEDANAMRTHSDSNAKKEKERKEKEGETMKKTKREIFIEKYGWDESPETLDILLKSYPRVMAMSRPLEKKEHDRLIEKYGAAKIRDTYRDMEAWAKLTTKTWAAGVADKWAGKENK